MCPIEAPGESSQKPLLAIGRAEDADNGTWQSAPTHHDL